MPQRPVSLKLLLLFCLLWSLGCATVGSNSQSTNPADLDLDLVNAVALFGPPPAQPAVDFAQPEDVLALTPEIRKFTKRLVRNGLPPMDRARRLVQALIRKDFFADGYYTDATRTAAELFVERAGNCLSYTNLYVAMARELGLDAQFQMARIPATWSSDSGYLVRSRHINVLIRDPRVPSADWVTVDFNKVATSSLYPHRTVSDAYALSSFYNNIAVDYLYSGNYRATVTLLAQAIEVDPTNADAWVNLAAVYSRHSMLEETRAAFTHALKVEPGNESALAGMVRLLKAEGNKEEALRVAEEMRSRRERDPYFHFAMAQAAYEQQDFDQSITHINRAIELRARSGPFYYLRALVQYAQGHFSQASASLEMAQKRKATLPMRKQQHALLLATRINERAAAEKGLN